MLEGRGQKIDLVIRLVVNDAALKARVAGRFAQSGRVDDNPVAFEQRLVAYNRDTSHLLPYYRGRGKLVEINGMLAMEDVTAGIVGAIAEAGL